MLIAVLSLISQNPVFVRETLTAVFQFKHHTRLFYWIFRNVQIKCLESYAAHLQKNIFNTRNLNIPVFTADQIWSIILSKALSIPDFFSGDQSLVSKVEKADKQVSIKSSWSVHIFRHMHAYKYTYICMRSPLRFSVLELMIFSVRC